MHWPEVSIKLLLGDWSIPLRSLPDPRPTVFRLFLFHCRAPPRRACDATIQALLTRRKWSTVSHHLGPCLLPLLQPVRHCLHGFLSAATAARLMEASRSLTVSLLAGYSFVDHVFTYDNQTAADVKRSIALYTRYRMRIVRMSLPRRWKGEPLVDSESGRSWLPASLEALALGPEKSDGKRRSMVYVTSCYCSHQHHVEDERQCTRQFIRLVRAWQSANGSSGTEWDAATYDICRGAFNQPIPPGALPRGLRFLQFNGHFNQPLQVGSIPDTVEALQFCRNFNQPLEVGHLPASLTSLTFGRHFNRSLQPGVLPAGLRSLHFGYVFDQRLQAGMLPTQLQHLSLDWGYEQPMDPGVIPPSVTHLRLRSVRYRLESGSIPHGVVYLDLGWSYDTPLLPGVLPTSLRVLVISNKFDRPLPHGSLPDGLEVLAFHSRASFQQPLQPGVIPATVVAVSLGRQYDVPLVPGGIPATVRWLRLPGHHAQNCLNGALAQSTIMAWWLDDE